LREFVLRQPALNFSIIFSFSAIFYRPVNILRRPLVVFNLLDCKHTHACSVVVDIVAM
jgi:hypothetical protein